MQKEKKIVIKCETVIKIGDKGSKISYLDIIIINKNNVRDNLGLKIKYVSKGFNGTYNWRIYKRKNLFFEILS